MEEEKDTDLSTIDNKDSMVKFMDAIRQRAKDLPANCAENTKPDVAAKALWLLAQGANIPRYAVLPACPTRQSDGLSGITTPP